MRVSEHWRCARKSGSRRWSKVCHDIAPQAGPATSFKDSGPQGLLVDVIVANGRRGPASSGIQPDRSHRTHSGGGHTVDTSAYTEINGFETKAEGNIRKLNARHRAAEVPTALEIAGGAAGTIPEGTFLHVPQTMMMKIIPSEDIRKCPRRDQRPTGTGLLHEHMNGVESLVFLAVYKPGKSCATEERFCRRQGRCPGRRYGTPSARRSTRDTGEITREPAGETRSVPSLPEWRGTDQQRRKRCAAKVLQGAQGLCPWTSGTADFQAGKDHQPR